MRIPVYKILCVAVTLTAALCFANVSFANQDRKEQIGKYLRDKARTTRTGLPGSFVVFPISASDIPYFTDFLDHPDPKFRAESCLALGFLGATEAVPKLMERLGDSDLSVKREAIRALGDIGDPRAVPHLKPFIDHRVESVRLASDIALLMLGEKRDGDRFARYMKSSDPQIRSVLVVYLPKLGLLGADLQRQLLVQGLKDSKADIRTNAAAGLQQLGDQSTKGALIQAMRDRHASVRGASINGLNKLNDRSLIHLFIQSLRDPADNVRRAAVEALLSFQDPSLLDFLVPMVHDPAAAVAGQALIGIAKFEDRRATEVLREALSKDDPYMRIYAAQGLSKREDRSWVPIILKLFCDSPEDHYFRRASKELLMQFGDESLLAEMDRIKTDPKYRNDVQDIIDSIQKRSRKTE